MEVIIDVKMGVTSDMTVDVTLEINQDGEELWVTQTIHSSDNKMNKSIDDAFNATLDIYIPSVNPKVITTADLKPKKEIIKPKNKKKSKKPQINLYDDYFD